FTLQSRDQASTAIQSFINRRENEIGLYVKSIFTDNAAELVCQDLENYFHQKGILHIRTAPYSPQQNSICERAHQSILNRIRTLLFDSQLPYPYWEFACHAGSY